MSANNRTFIQRIYLDKIFTRRNSGGNHWIGSTIKAWRFVGSNSKAFKLWVIADPVEGSAEGIPIHLIKIHNYSRLANFGCFENFEEQPNVWVDVLVSVEDSLLWTGEPDEGGNTVSLGEGTVFENDSVEVDDSGTIEVCQNDTERVVSELYNYSANTVYVGTLDAVSDANYADLCVKIRPGEMYEWRLGVALFGVTDSGVVAKLNIIHKRAA